MMIWEQVTTTILLGMVMLTIGSRLPIGRERFDRSHLL